MAPARHTSSRLLLTAPLRSTSSSPPLRMRKLRLGAPKALVQGHSVRGQGPDRAHLSPWPTQWPQSSPWKPSFVTGPTPRLLAPGPALGATSWGATFPRTSFIPSPVQGQPGEGQGRRPQAAGTAGGSEGTWGHPGGGGGTGKQEHGVSVDVWGPRRAGPELRGGGGGGEAPGGPGLYRGHWALAQDLEKLCVREAGPAGLSRAPGPPVPCPAERDRPAQALALCVPPPQSLPPLLLVKLIQERLGEDDCLRRVSALRGSGTRAREGEGRVSTPVLRRR